MKKSVSLLLAGLMLCGALAGCGGNDSADANNAAEGGDAAASGTSGAITVISREDGSGTRSAFVELTGVEDDNGDNTTVDAEIANKTDVVLTSVAGNESSIGYVSLGSLNDTVKAVKVDGVEAKERRLQAVPTVQHRHQGRADRRCGRFPELHPECGRPGHR